MLLLAIGVAALLVLAVYLGAPTRRNGAVVYSDAQHTGAKALRDYRLRLVGKPDYIVRENGALIPEEVKSAHAARPYESDVIQLGTYFLLIEANYGTQPPYGRLRYANQTFTIQNTDALRADVLAARDRYLAVRDHGEPPTSHPAPGLCRRCAFAHLCPDSQA